MHIIASPPLLSNSVVEYMRRMDRDKQQYSDIHVPLQVLK